MTTPVWSPTTLYAPGAIVSPKTTNIVVQDLPYNNDFNLGLTQWTITGQYCSNTAAIANTHASGTQTYGGSTYSCLVSPFAGDGTGPHSGTGNAAAFVIVSNNYMAPVTPGQKINFSCRMYYSCGDVNQSFCSGGPRIAWYNASSSFLSYSYASAPAQGINNGGTGMYSGNQNNWSTVSGTGIAPVHAAFAQAVIVMSTTIYSGQSIFGADYVWDFTTVGYPTGLVFVAIQAANQVSGAVEPAWPVTVGSTVYDPNTAGVEWQAEFASVVTWQCGSILKSGNSQPTWPTVIGTSVADNTIEWVATDGRIQDTNCPQSPYVAIASAKVYAADNDIIRFCATANPIDWTSPSDAGFIPFGLQTNGNEPCLGLGLYRSNLTAFNSLGYQMWQVDPDPTNIAILDAEPVGCEYSKSIQPVNNDLVFLSSVGIRNIGTVGVSGNLEAGQFGKQVDSLVAAFVKAANAAGIEIKSLFNPGTGQYWLMCGTNVIVLTINGASVMSWSRYLFPSKIDYWTILSGALYLRSGDLVWTLDTTNTVFVDDSGGANTGYQGYMAWNYIDCGQIGVDKEMEGFDLTIGQIDDQGQIDNNNVVCNVSIGYNQSNREQATPEYAVTGDTIPGTMIPFPMTAPSFQLRLDFGTGQDWGWGAANLYAEQLGKQ